MNKFKVLAIGDIVIDHYLESGKEYVGGSATNVGLTISRNNPESRVDLLGIIGKDQPGRQLISRLNDTNLNLDKIIKLPGETARAVWRRTDLTTELVEVDKGVDQGITLDYLRNINLEYYDLVHATPYSLGIDEIKYLKNQSQKFSFDSSFVFKKEELIDLIPGTSWFFISGDLARNYHWLDALKTFPEEALILLNGEEGVRCIHEGLTNKLEIKSYFKGNIYDDLGAGDIFIGILLAEYYKNFSGNKIKDLLERASEKAGKACQYEGASNLRLV
ncbi:MAG: PfkB family carbohydrate kinase [Bacillota bacterium]